MQFSTDFVQLYVVEHDAVVHQGRRLIFVDGTDTGEVEFTRFTALYPHTARGPSTVTYLIGHPRIGYISQVFNIVVIAFAEVVTDSSTTRGITPVFSGHASQFVQYRYAFIVGRHRVQEQTTAFYYYCTVARCTKQSRIREVFQLGYNRSQTSILFQRSRNIHVFPRMSSHAYPAVFTLREVTTNAAFEFQ